MTPGNYICQRQLLWAKRKGLEPDEQGYVASLDLNLFQPLSQEAQSAFEAADGNEMGKGGSAKAKMRALHSSSALAVNVFHYWQNRPDVDLLAQALEIPSQMISGIQFEARLPIAADVDRVLFPKDPNLDVLIRYQSRPDRLKAVGIECKMSEAYGQHEGLREPYFHEESLWEKLPACQALAQKVRDTSASGLNTPQLLKHLLALKHAAGDGPFWLLYIWYGTPTEEMGTHFQQLRVFQEAVEADGGRFHFLTYQELILRLLAKLGVDHHPYVEYLADRYL